MWWPHARLYEIVTLFYSIHYQLFHLISHEIIIFIFHFNEKHHIRNLNRIYGQKKFFFVVNKIMLHLLFSWILCMIFFKVQRLFLDKLNRGTKFIIKIKKKFRIMEMKESCDCIRTAFRTRARLVCHLVSESVITFPIK